MKQINAIMNRVHNANVGLLLIRIAIGVVFIHAGWMKVTNMDQVLMGFSMMGVPAFLTYIVAYSEFLGGILLLIGAGVRYVGVILAVIMFVAFYMVHMVNGFGLGNNPEAGGGFAFVWTLGLSAIALVLMGAGKYSIDAWLAKSKN